MQVYSDPSRETDPYALPDVEVFYLSPIEVASIDEDTIAEYARFHEYQLCHMSAKVREQMLDSIVAQQSIKGGWFYQFCFPGCLPDSDPVGPFATADEAKAAAQEDGQ